MKSSSVAARLWVPRRGGRPPVCHRVAFGQTGQLLLLATNHTAEWKQRSAPADHATLAKPNPFRTHRPDFCGPQRSGGPAQRGPGESDQHGDARDALAGRFDYLPISANALLRVDSNSSPGFHTGIASVCAMSHVESMASCASSITPSKFQLSSSLSAGWW